MHWAVSFALGVLLTGCATIVKGTTQSIAIHTPGVTGAQCTLNSSAIGTRVVVTPATLVVEKGMDNITVRCTKDCYHDGTSVIASNTEAMTAGNILVGGVIGLGVDAATGAMNKYTPETGIAMVPVPGCRAARA